jgi:fluoride exporter
MVRILVIGLGGFLGAVARYAVAGVVQQRSGALYPAGTLAVNLVGCALLGALFGLVEARPALGPGTRAFLAIGFLGSFTTFSTFGFETLELVRIGAPRLALGNIVANVVGGLGVLWLARAAVRALVG